MKPFAVRITVALILAVLFTAPVSAGEFSVGVELPLTGSLARVGAGMREGIEVAADLYNRSGGSHSIRLVIIDDESSPAKAIAAVEKLAAARVVALTGGYSTGIIGPASEAAGRYGLVYMTSGGVDDRLVERGLENFFRINNHSGYLKALLGILGQMHPSSVSVIHSTRESTTALAEALRRELPAGGIEVFLHPFDPTIPDFKPLINKIKLRDRPEVIVMLGYENDYIGILRAARILKPDVSAVLGIWALATPKMASEFPALMSNVYGTASISYPVRFNDREGTAFLQAYRRIHGKEPDYLGQFGYVQAILLFEAIGRAADNGLLAQGKLADELRKTDRETPIGRVRFDEKGDNPEFTHRVGQHQQGKIVIVWPPEEATGSRICSGKPW